LFSQLFNHGGRCAPRPAEEDFRAPPPESFQPPAFSWIAALKNASYLRFGREGQM
jgi:hypothetical protein